MQRFLLHVAVGALALTPGLFATSLFAMSNPEHGPGAPPPPAVADAAASANVTPSVGIDASFLPPLPTAPNGKSTVIGGVIRSIDPVLDQMTLNVYGNGKPMKILFDERTKFYRDGVKTPLDDMRPNDHASVETLLDGDSVFALSVHMLSGAPEGDCQGQVLAFDPRNGEMTVRNNLSGAPIKLRVDPRTTIARIGQPAFASSVTGTSDLMYGALISVKFSGDNRGNAVADAISILAIPGSGFYFSGNVTYLDVQAGLMAVTDPRDQRNYSIAFNPSLLPATRKLLVGSRVGVTASFNGKQYVANKLDVY